MKLYLKKYIAIFSPKFIYISLADFKVGMGAVPGDNWKKKKKDEPKSHKNRRLLLDNIAKYTNSNLV